MKNQVVVDIKPLVGSNKVSYLEHEFYAVESYSKDKESNYNLEWCACCDSEVLLEKNLNEQLCPACHKPIINCSYCMLTLGNQCDPEKVKCGCNKYLEED